MRGEGERSSVRGKLSHSVWRSQDFSDDSEADLTDVDEKATEVGKF